ncbi:hypothetical protein GCM10010302_25470 [Streptomyces polychromogenes]|uniref:Uncharacterized protein n=1 Tax=Streptomyces polychromogenes TaxID=67342 RepID=A0ABN0VC74_9ACTN
MYGTSPSPPAQTDHPGIAAPADNGPAQTTLIYDPQAQAFTRTLAGVLGITRDLAAQARVGRLPL